MKEKPLSATDGSPAQTPITRRQLLSGAAGAAAALPIAKSTWAAGPDRNLANMVQNMRSTEETSLKQQAMDDYRRSMAKFGGQLSNPPEQLFGTSLNDPRAQFDVLIIGSGYGASICAARLASRMQPGRRLAIIERGREWIPGTFNDRFGDLTREARNQLFGRKKRTVVQPLGLHNVIMCDDINVWTGNGLGGGSLINASIALIPDHEVFSKFKWPANLSSLDNLMPYFQRAARGLNLMRTPVDQTPKVSERRMAADRLHPIPGFFDLSPISVMYDQRYLDDECRNPQGVIQRPCTLCGDCVTGCNVGAKNTLTTNFLPIARSHGAEIYTQVEVRSIEKENDLYKVNLVYFDDRQCSIVRRYTSVYAAVVILGAGSPGSPKILLKSRDKGLCCSPALGHRWSGNGDTVGFVVDKSSCSEIGGVGAYESKTKPIGPTVQSSLNYQHRQSLERRILVQDAAIPRGASNLLGALLHDPQLDNSAVMLGMGHDGAGGRIEIDRGQAKIVWPGLKEAAFRQQIWAEFERIAVAEGGRYKRLKAFGDNLVSVHPLGGCALADDPIDGVVNEHGQVFDGSCGGYSQPNGLPAVHQGLYVADGSIIPSSLGCNPLLTISALAERISEGILTDSNLRDIFAPLPV